MKGLTGLGMALNEGTVVLNQERKDLRIDRIGYSLNEGTIVLNQERKDVRICRIGHGIE